MNPTAPTQQTLKPVLYMLLAMAMWAVIENIPGFFSQKYTSFEIVWMRYSIHLLTLLLIFGPWARLRLVRTRRLPLQLLRGLLMLGMHLCFIFAIKFLTLDSTMAGFWIAPLLLLGISAWVGKRAGKLHWAVTLLGFGCVLIILRPLEGIMNLATLLSIGMALCFVLYMQMTRAMPGEDILASLFYTAFSVWLVLSVLIPFSWVTPTGIDLLLFAAIGLLGIVCIYGFDKAAELAPTWVSAPYSLVQPILILGINLGLWSINPGKLSLAAASFLLACLAFLAMRPDSIRKIIGYQHVR